MDNSTLTVKELAEKLHVSTTTIYSMVKDMQIPHVRARSKIIFHKPTINKWLAGDMKASKKEDES